MKAPSWPFLIGSALLLAVAVTVSLANKLGAFKAVTIERRMDGPYDLVSKDHLGPYHQIAPVISEVEAWAKKHGEPCPKSFGEYYDNPETTDEDRLRSRGGCILSTDALKSLEKTPDGLAPGYAISTIASRDAMIATFEGAPSIGPWKVYPKVMEEIQRQDLELNGPVLEIYEILSETEGRTRYVFPVRSLRTK